MASKRHLVRQKSLTALIYLQPLILLFSMILVASVTKTQAQSSEELPSLFEIRSLAWSPDGNRIAIGRGTNECSDSDLSPYAVEVIDSSNQSMIHNFLGHNCSVNSLSWSSDGQRIASASSDGSLRIWDTTTGASLNVIETESFYGRLDTRWRVSSNTIASIAQAGSSRVQIIDWPSGNILQRFAEQASSLSWSPDGSQLAVGQYDDVVTIWDVDNGDLLRTLYGHTSDVLTVAWSQDGTFIASGGADNTVRIWNAQTGDMIYTFSGHTGYVNALDWHPDSQTIASTSYDGTIRLWNALDGSALDEISVSSSEWINAVAWSPDGNRIAFGGSSTNHNAEIEVAVWNENNLSTATPTNTPTNTPTHTPTDTPTPTPTPNPSQCIGLSILPDGLVTIHNSPFGGEVIGSFGDRGASTHNVQITGRYTANTLRRWDDWYQVTYIDRRYDNEPRQGWVSAEYTTLRPSYRDSLCAVPEYSSNENNELLPPVPPSPLPPEPQPVPQAAELYAYAQELRLPAPFTQLPTDPTMFSSFGWS